MFKKSVILVIAAVIVVSLAAAAFWGPAAKRQASVREQNKIAIIYIDGVIIGGRGQASLLGDSGGTDAVIRQLHDARDDAGVRAVILRINSPGGSAPASQEVADEVKKLRATGKPVVTSMADMAASGGYWIAAVTDKIYANPATITGSIGVYIPYANWEELYNKIGIHQEKIKSGPHKDILSPERQMTKDERAIIQTMVDDLYNQFVTVVAEGRHMDPDKVRQLADGRVYTGSQAKEVGLVDEMGTMYDAIDGTAKLAGIQGKPQIKEYGKQTPWQLIFGSNSQFSLENILTKQLKNELPITAPLALPERW
ncbi:MAG: signal peptide peptidase SppA [Negativicutes bacterium]|nr:signal peptide peptidase SppA [Negativicutes bacterium]